MRNRIISFMFAAFFLCCSVVPASASSDFSVMSLSRPNVADMLDNGGSYKHVDRSPGAFIPGGGASRGGGAGRRKYYTTPSSPGTGSGGGGFRFGTGIIGGGGAITSSGANSDVMYNSGPTASRSVFDKDFTSYYNPVSGSYDSIGDAYYNTENNNIIKVENNIYLTYIIFCRTYVAYYIESDYIENPENFSSWYVEMYYALPDGRNSYDIEMEDIWGEYFIYDTTNYREAVEDDGVTQALYHLDGNGYDSSAKNADALDWGTRYVDTPFGSGYQVYNTKGSGQYRYTVSLSIPADVNTIEFRYFLSAAAYVDTTVSNVPKNNWIDQPPSNSYGVATSMPRGYIFDVSVDTETWHSIAVVFDGDTGTVYIDGVNKGTTTRSSSISIGTYSYWNSVSFGRYRYLYNGKESSVPLNGFKYYANQYAIIDEVRLSNKALYTEDYTPRQQPFDTNLVLVTPDPETIDENTIAVQSRIPTNNLRVGGVRPTFCENGDVYVALSDDVVVSVQQYQNDGWQEVNASFYINGEWVSLYGYNLSDYKEVNPDGDIEPTPTPGGDIEPTPSPGGSSDFSHRDILGELLEGAYDALKAVLDLLLRALWAILSSFLSILLWAISQLNILIPFLPAPAIAALAAGVIIVLVLSILKFIFNLL